MITPLVHRIRRIGRAPWLAMSAAIAVAACSSPGSKAETTPVETPTPAPNEQADPEKAGQARCIGLEPVACRDAGCGYVEPGCGGNFEETGLRGPGCFGKGNCRETGCSDGLDCRRVSVDPCAGSNCNACAEEAHLCVPPDSSGSTQASPVSSRGTQAARRNR